MGAPGWGGGGGGWCMWWEPFIMPTPEAEPGRDEGGMPMGDGLGC